MSLFRSLKSDQSWLEKLNTSRLGLAVFTFSCPFPCETNFLQIELADSPNVGERAATVFRILFFKTLTFSEYKIEGLGGELETHIWIHVLIQKGNRNTEHAYTHTRAHFNRHRTATTFRNHRGDGEPLICRNFGLGFCHLYVFGDGS